MSSSISNAARNESKAAEQDRLFREEKLRVVRCMGGSQADLGAPPAIQRQHQAATKRSMVEQQALFREEKQRIVVCLGGSRAELMVPPSADSPMQRKGPTESSLIPKSSSDFQQTNDEEQSVSDGLPIPLEYGEEEEEHEGTLRHKIRVQCTPKRVVAVVIVILAVIAVGVGSALFMKDDSIPPTKEPVDDEHCPLDREEITNCTPWCDETRCIALAVPTCAVWEYQVLAMFDFDDLYRDHMDYRSAHCDAEHQGILSLATARVNDEAIGNEVLFWILSTLYFALGGTQWRVDTNWLHGSPCTWHGIECHGEDKISISLENNRLQGFIPSHIGLLSNNLIDFNIGSSDVSGTLPVELGLLTRLQTLVLDRTSIHSKFPSQIGRLRNLTKLSVDSTPLTGTIPTEIGSVTQLEKLELRSNKFSGTLPTELGNLKRLTSLGLWDLNYITGTLPLELKALTRLRRLQLLLFDLDPSPLLEVNTVATNLETIAFDQTHLTGSMSATIGRLSHLKRLTLGFLDTSGSIPTEIGLLSDSLAHLILARSNLNGTIPASVGQLTKLTRLELNHRPQLHGTLPSELGSLTALESFHVANTALTGTIPDPICALRLGTRFRFDNCETSFTNETCVTDTCKQ